MAKKSGDDPETASFHPPGAVASRPHPTTSATSRAGLLGTALLVSMSLVALYHFKWMPLGLLAVCRHPGRLDSTKSPYGRFPKAHDLFQFMPCTNATVPPALDDFHHKQTWAGLFDPDPNNWSWSDAIYEGDETVVGSGDPYAGKGIYLCGYLDAPLDYTNGSDRRIVRLAVTKLQVSGLALADGSSPSWAGSKSARTIVVEPGGPGGSGTGYMWRAAKDVTGRFSDNSFDVLGWDPRGVNASLPLVDCFPYDGDRDRWALLTKQYYEVSSQPRHQLEVADAMNEAIWRSCYERHGDLPRFVGTAFVARDLEQIRLALGEPELTGYLVSYGTGIGQTYANMFPNSVGRMILDGTEYVRDHRLLGGFGWTALDNGTDAWHDGFLGECVSAGLDHCALATPISNQKPTVQSLEERMESLFSSLIDRPAIGYTEYSGPSLVTYSALVEAIYSAMYNAKTWPGLARTLFELEAGNSTLATHFLEERAWAYDPSVKLPPGRVPASTDLEYLVICSDSYDAPLPPDGLEWWESLWANMTRDSWVAGNSRFWDVFPCQHFTEYWPRPAEVYRGDLNSTLRSPVLLIAETYDPATPLRNGRRLLREMGDNARLVVHHGYGHSARDKSNCTDATARAFILHGTVPKDPETSCYADGKPYLYGDHGEAKDLELDPLYFWRDHLQELAVTNPGLLR